MFNPSSSPNSSPSGSGSKSTRNFEKHLAGKLASDVAEWESNRGVHIQISTTARLLGSCQDMLRNCARPESGSSVGH